MEDNNKEKIKESIKNATEKMKKDNDFFKSQRKAALTWNIIFFIGILTTTIAVSIFTKSESFNFKEIFTEKLSEKLSLLTAILSLVISFMVGILGSYFKTKSLNNQSDFNVKDFITEAYIDRLDKSELNPQRK